MPSSVVVASQAGEPANHPVQGVAELFPADAGDPAVRFLHRLGVNWLGLFLLALLAYGPLEKLFVPWAIQSLTQGKSWHADLESLLTGFVEFPFFFAFYLWSSKHVAGMFASFSQNKNFSDELRYRDFTRSAAAAFRRPGWWVAGVVAAIAVVLYYQFRMWGEGAEPSPWFKEGGMVPRVLALGLLGLVAYVVSQTLFRQGLALLWLRRLWRELGSDLVVHPYHPDESGGLGCVGRLAIAIFGFFAVATLCLGMGSLLPSLRAGKLSFAKLDSNLLDKLFWDPAIGVGWALLAAGLVLSLAGLLMPAHAAMIANRDARLDPISKELDDHVESIISAHAAPRDISAVLAEVKRLKKIRRILLNETPVWPITVPLTRWLTGSLVLTVAGNVLSALLTPPGSK